ncbi:MAG: hypothetical protein V1837_05910 [Candidatus Woesearchaeota archaeon]
MRLLQIVSLVLAVVMVLGLTLMALGKITPLQFWLTAIIIALIAYGILPRIKKP